MRHYAEGGGRLVAIECDSCDALIAPNPDIANSGWVKCGMTDDSGNRFEYDYCPTHADRADSYKNETAEEWKTRQITERRRR